MKFEVNLSESKGKEERIRREARRKNMKDMKDSGMESKRLELLLSNSLRPVIESWWKCWWHDRLSPTSKHQNVHVDKRRKIKLTWSYLIVFDHIWSSSDAMRCPCSELQIPIPYWGLSRITLPARAMYPKHWTDYLKDCKTYLKNISNIFN